jgi:hypothetical protein
MKKKVINNLKKYKYNWLSVVFILFLLFTKHIVFIVLFFISVLMSEFKK